MSMVKSAVVPEMSHVFKAPPRAEIDAAAAPFIQKRMPLQSAEWQDLYNQAARKERKIYFRYRLKQWLPTRKHARPQTLVSTHYETHWSSLEWPRTIDPKPEKPVLCTWGDEGLLVRRYGRKRAHHLVFARWLRGQPLGTALEVGCGNCINLLIMAALFPHIQWQGVELTEAGVAVGRSVANEPELPEVLQQFAIEPIQSKTGHRAVKFQQGDASKLPFPDKSFDLVFSFQALEQMQIIRDKAVREMVRVARKYVVMTEPLSDFNQTEIQHHYMRSRGYLDLGTD